MADKEELCYAYIQLPGTFEWAPCASLKVRKIAADACEGTFTYGKRYLERSNVVELDPYHLKLTTKPLKFTMLKGIPGALRDASPDAWGRRVIQARLQREEADVSEMEYLLNGPDDGAGNLRFGLSVQPPGPAKSFNRTHQLEALVLAAEQLEETGKLPHEVLEQLEPGTSMGGARPKVTVEDGRRVYLAKLPEKRDTHNMQRIEYATLELAREAGLHVCGARIEPVGKAEALMLLRFDREWNPDALRGAGEYARHGLVSGLTVLLLGPLCWRHPRQLQILFGELFQQDTETDAGFSFNLPPSDPCARLLLRKLCQTCRIRGICSHWRRGQDGNSATVARDFDGARSRERTQQFAQAGFGL